MFSIKDCREYVQSFDTREELIEWLAEYGETFFNDFEGQVLDHVANKDISYKMKRQFGGS
jgi:hypothetical protein